MAFNEVTFTITGYVESCFKQKFSIPRQPGLASCATGKLTFIPPYNREEFFRGIDLFSHIWVHFIFHETLHEGWKPTIRPPRLGGRKRLGVFATRATHRPNAMGSSVVKLESIEQSPDKGTVLYVSGIDMLDGTPIVDIKPYLPYSDRVTEATGELIGTEEKNPRAVTFSGKTELICRDYEKKTGRKLYALIKQVLTQDPRPAWLRKKSRKHYYTLLWNANISWTVEENSVNVISIEFN